LAALLALAGGGLLVAVAMSRGGSPLAFLDPIAFLFVLGGTIAATLINYPLPRVKAALGALRAAFARQRQELSDLVLTMLDYAERARREGVLDLEDEAEHAPDPCLRAGLSLVVDGTDPESVREILENDLAALEARQKLGAGLFETMATYAPGFGMVGTLIALVQMLQKLDDPSRLTTGMATALLPTLYGVLLANLFFTPLAGKLKVRATEEVQRAELILEGLLAIQAGDTPGILAQKLNSFLPPEQRTRRATVRDLYDDEDTGREVG